MQPAAGNGQSGATALPGWVEKAGAVLFCVFCLEIGLFLLVYPWLESWRTNYLVQWQPEWRPLLTSHEFRGALSGLGILNLFIGLYEIVGLRRFSARRPRT